MNPETTTSQTQKPKDTQQPEKHFVVELNSGEKCEGILVNIDKLNFTIQLKNVKKYPAKKEGNENQLPEEFEVLNINKADIKEVQLIQFEQKEDKPQEVNVNAIPQEKIPSNANAQVLAKNYDKNESFFDSLASMTHPQAKEESRNYNNKNIETFNLPNEQRDNKDFQYNNRGGGRGRGYGRYGRGGGYYQQQHQQYQQGQGQGQGGYNKGYYGNQQGGYNQYQQGGYNQYQQGGGGYNQGYYPNNQFQQYQGGYNKGYNQGGYNQGGFNQGGFNQQQGGFNQQQGGFNQGYNNYHHNQGRGRGRGGRGGRGQGYNYNNRGAFQKGKINQNQPLPQEPKPEQDTTIKSIDVTEKVEAEKSIYDEEKK